MLDNHTKLNIAVTRFAGFVSELPHSPTENDVLEYHDILDPKKDADCLWLHLSILCLAKTSAATKNEAFLGRAGLNVIIASTEHADFAGQETMCSCSTHV